MASRQAHEPWQMPPATHSAGPAADVSGGQEVLALRQSDFVLLVLLIVAAFYLGAAVVYRLALSPSKDSKRPTAAARKRD